MTMGQLRSKRSKAPTTPLALIATISLLIVYLILFNSVDNDYNNHQHEHGRHMSLTKLRNGLTRSRTKEYAFELTNRVKKLLDNNNENTMIGSSLKDVRIGSVTVNKVINNNDNKIKTNRQ